VLCLVLCACGRGEESAPPPTVSGDPPAPEPVAGVGGTFDPARGAPIPPSAEGVWAETMVHVDEGEIRVIEETYRNGEKKSRREVKKTDVGIVNHGPYVRWYKNGVVAEEGEYVDGKRVGTFIERLDTGQMKSEIPYDENGEIHGTRREWSDVGFVKKEAEFRHGLPHGSYKIYGMLYEGQRFERIAGTHEEGRKTGTWTYAYIDGQKREQGEYVDDLRSGLWTSWWRNGQLQREAHHRAGVWHGTVTEYDEEGRMSSTGNYVDGEPEGTHTTFYASGGKRAEKTYRDGRPNGPAATWFEDGQMESRGELVDGKQEGEWTYWFPDGSINEEWTGLYHAGERAAADG